MIYSDWRSQIFERKKMATRILAQQVFRHFLEFGSFVFVEIVYNDSLQQCLTSTRGETYEKRFGTQIGPNESKSDQTSQTSQNYVFRNFLKFGLLVLREIAYNRNLQQFMKLTEKVFCHFLKYG